MHGHMALVKSHIDTALRCFEMPRDVLVFLFAVALEILSNMGSPVKPDSRELEHVDLLSTTADNC